MIKARGLKHINLNVRDIGRSLKFYQEAFGLEVKFWEGKTLVFLSSPGANDTITPVPGQGRTILLPAAASRISGFRPERATSTRW